MTWRGKRIGVLMGGPSAEREISLRTGAGVLRALVTRGYDAVAIDWTGKSSLTTQLRSAAVDVVWIALHGTHGEDGTVQGLLECERIPYTGSGVLASAIAFDKVASKRLFSQAKLPTPEWQICNSVADAVAFGLPMVVKPACEGSSVGITIVKAAAEIEQAVKLAQRYHGATIVERFIEGEDVTVGILEEAVLGSIEIRPAVAFYDYQAKYERKDTRYDPPELPDEELGRIHAVALQAHKLLGCAVYSRVDLRVTAKAEAFVLEVNTLPGLTSTSLLPKMATAAGLTYEDLVERILAGARLHLDMGPKE